MRRSGGVIGWPRSEWKKSCIDGKNKGKSTTTKGPER